MLEKNISPTTVDGRRLSTAMAGGDPANPFKPLGIGLPLLVELRHIYTGKNGGGIFGRSDFLVTSAVKSIETQGATPRGLNRLAHAPGAHAYIGFNAAEPGTPILYYSPAVTSFGTLVTIEFSQDRFERDTIDAAAEVLKDAGALPVFAAANTYLLGASAVIKIAGSVLENIFDSVPFLSETLSIQFDAAGLPNFVAGYYVLVASSQKAQLEAEAVIGADGQMKTKADTSRAYQGDVPYVVLAVDGRSRSPQLDGFALKAAEASLLERFMKTGSLSQAVLRDLDTALGLFNDFSFRQKVNEIDDALKKPGLTPEEIKALNDARGAYVKNIRSKEFQP
jgi:hypothetical protein